MRRAATLLLAFAALAAPAGFASRAAAQTSAVDPVRLDLGRQIIAIMYPPDKRDAMLSSLIQNVLSQYRASMSQPSVYADPGMKQILDQAFASIPVRLGPTVRAHLPRLFEAMAHAYARDFTTPELQEIAAFGRTPAGRHYLQNSVNLMSDPDVAAANTAYFGELQQLNLQITADFRRNVTTYLQAHPDVAARLKSQQGQ